MIKEFDNVTWEDERTVILSEEIELNEIVKISDVYYKIITIEGNRVKVNRATPKEVLSMYPYLAYKH